jgi:hypothetical protein
MNGEATVETISSCCPLIGDPWQMPMIDVDAVLVAIRIATYGEKMEMEIPIPGLKEPTNETIEIDLRQVLDGYQSRQWIDFVEYQDLKFHLTPLTYKQSTDLFQSTYENQRLATILQDTKTSDADKMEAFKLGFKKLSQVTLNTVLGHVKAIETPEGIEDNPKAIREFFDNTDKDTFLAVSEHLDKMRKQFNAKPQIYKVPKEHVDNGAPEEIEVPMVFDQSNFFVSK